MSSRKNRKTLGKSEPLGLGKKLVSWILARRWQLGCAGLYLILALILTREVTMAPFSKLPIGTEPTASVPLYNVWATWWNADRLAGGFMGYWDAPIFFPTQGSFALMEPQPTTLLVAPVVWITGSRILAYNCYVWLSIVLNGVFAQRMARVYGVGRWSALWAGVAMVLLPIVHWQLGIIQLAPLWGILWTWTAIEQLCREPSRRRALTLGIAASVSFLTCMHHGLFLAVLLLCAAPVLWRHLTKFRELRHWGLAVAVALTITVPFVSQVNRVTEIHAIEWGEDLVTGLSAQWNDYFQTAGYELIKFGGNEKSPLFLSSGWLKYLLALAGVVFGLRTERTRRLTSFLLAIVGFAFLLSLGPNLRLGSFQPWWWLSENVPGFSRVRSVMRFAFFVQVPVVIFAALGLGGIYQLTRERLTHPRMLLATHWGVVVLALAALVDGYPKEGGDAEITDFREHEKWLSYVERNTPEGQGILCLPVAPGPRVWEYLVTSEWMYLGTFHQKPIFNGYSSHFPAHYRDLRDEILAGFPTENLLRQFHQGRVRFIAVRAKKGSPARNLILGDYGLKRVCVDELVEVYELVKKP